MTQPLSLSASCPLAPLLPFASCLLDGCRVVCCRVPPPCITFHYAATARIQTMATVRCAVAIVADVVVHRAVTIVIINVVIRRAIAIVVDVVVRCVVIVVIVVVARHAIAVIINVVVHPAVAIIVYLRSILHTQK